MPKCAKGRSDIYDLISLKVVDKKEFDKMVTAERNLKKRYEIKNEMNKYYHELDLKKQDKEMNKYNNNKEEESFKSKNKIKNINDDWQKILHGAGKK